jgi:hypothetical protein
MSDFENSGDEAPESLSIQDLKQESQNRRAKEKFIALQ